MAHKNAKFDSYLKRTLDDKVYEQVRVSDPCIVHGRNEKHTFRFIFITDEAICVTQNPPKSILFSIPLSDLRDVQLVHDTPKFLQKELQAMVQHVSIQHVANVIKESGSRSQRWNSSGSSSSVLKNVLYSLSNLKRRSPSGINVSSGVSGKDPSNSTKSNNTSSNAIPDTVMPAGESQFSINKNNHNNNPKKGLLDRSYRSSFPKQLQSPKSSADTLSHSVTGFQTGQSDAKSFTSWDSFKSLKGDPLKIEVAEQTLVNVEELHIYILNDASVFFMMLKVVWRAYILKSTELMAGDQKSIVDVTSTNQDLTNTLLVDLKNDIIDGFHQPLPLKCIYKYFYELKTAGESYFMAKKYFWKDSSFFAICADYLSKYSYPGSANHSNRADEVECMVLICEALSEMLRHTEGLSSNIKILYKSCDSAFYERLMKLLVSKPNLPTTFENDKEMTSLVQDYTVAASHVLYELMAAAEQVSWNAAEILEPALTSSSLFASLNLHSDLVSFLQSVFAKCVSIWTSAPKTPDPSMPSTSTSSHVNPDNSLDQALPPADIVKIYRSFTVLYRCLTKCNQVKLSKKCFKEEFKYYIRPENLNLKIPPCFPASAITRNVVSGVGACVLEEDATTFRRKSGDMA